MKRTYQSPAIHIVELDTTQHILTGSKDSGLTTNSSGSLENEADFGTQKKESSWNSSLWSEMK